VAGGACETCSTRRCASLSKTSMKIMSDKPPIGAPLLAWVAAAFFGVVAPAAAMLLLADAVPTPPLSGLGGTLLAVGLMGVGMIGAAAAGSLGVAVGLALLAGASLGVLANALGMASLAYPFTTVFAGIVASMSFAARGALFARSAANKGWWIAVFVVMGEVSILGTAMAMPDVLPGWLLALLPAQWASVAIHSALSGSGPLAASAPLIALMGTAAATLMVARLWPRRWPYAIMFTTWLGCSALVWHWPAGTSLH